MLQVILTKNHEILGNQGDLILVSPGYARNFLFPKKLAVEATVQMKKHYAVILEQRAKKIEAEKKAQQEIAQKLEGQEINVKAKAGPNKKLFGSVTTQDIAKAILAQLNIDINRRWIKLPEAIRHTGIFKNVKVKLFREVTANISVKIEAAVERDDSQEHVEQQRKKRKTVLLDMKEKLSQQEQAEQEAEEFPA